MKMMVCCSPGLTCSPWITLRLFFQATATTAATYFYDFMAQVKVTLTAPEDKHLLAEIRTGAALNAWINKSEFPARDKKSGRITDQLFRST